MRKEGIPVRVRIPVLLLIAISVLFAGCEVVVTSSPGDADLRVTRAEFVTNHTLDGQSVICDDRTTYLDFTVWFEGYTPRATVWLEGYDSGNVEGIRSFTPSGQVIEGQFTIPSRTTPLSFTPQAIVVTPKPVIIGYTVLHTSLEGAPRPVDLWSDPIPVIADCG